MSTVCSPAVANSAHRDGWASAVWLGALATALALGLAAFTVRAAPALVPVMAPPPASVLPAPRAQGPVSFEAVLSQRRSLRSFGAMPKGKPAVPLAGKLRIIDFALNNWASRFIVSVETAAGPSAQPASQSPGVKP